MTTDRNLEFLSIEQWQLGVEQALHIELARSNLAMHMTLLGISRWASGNSLFALQLAKAINPSPRIAWLDAANTNFQAWLEAGGFAQPEPEALAPLSAEITLNQAEDGSAGTGINTGAPIESPKRAINNSASSCHRMKHHVKNARIGNVPSISPLPDIPGPGGFVRT